MVIFYLNAGGVVAAPLMEAYDSLALEDNLEIIEAVLDRGTSAAVASSSQTKKQTHTAHNGAW